MIVTLEKKASFAFILILFFSYLNAQERIVKVDFESGSFYNNPRIPFDEPIVIMGETGRDIEFVKVNIGMYIWGKTEKNYKNMKAIKIIFLLLLFAIVLTFAYQNLEKVTVTFIIWSITVPFSLTTFLSFIVGILAGGLAIFSLGKKKKEDDDVVQTGTKPDKTGYF